MSSFLERSFQILTDPLKRDAERISDAIGGSHGKTASRQETLEALDKHHSTHTLLTGTPGSWEYAWFATEEDSQAFMRWLSLHGFEHDYTGTVGRVGIVRFR